MLRHAAASASFRPPRCFVSFRSSQTFPWPLPAVSSAGPVAVLEAGTTAGFSPSSGNLGHVQGSLSQKGARWFKGVVSACAAGVWI